MSTPVEFSSDEDAAAAGYFTLLQLENLLPGVTRQALRDWVTHGKQTPSGRVHLEHAVVHKGGRRPTIYCTKDAVQAFMAVAPPRGKGRPNTTATRTTDIRVGPSVGPSVDTMESVFEMIALRQENSQLRGDLAALRHHVDVLETLLQTERNEHAEERARFVSLVTASLSGPVGPRPLPPRPSRAGLDEPV